MADITGPRNPFVGPVPFSADDKDFFFGRETEEKLLYATAITDRIVLFYAKSGAGKTSLINTSLIPSLRKKYQVLPIGRVGRDLPAGSSYDQVYNVYTFNTLLNLGVKSKSKELETKTLVSIKNEKLVDIDFERPHWLIFDQFEELVTTHPEHHEKRADFFDQLRDLLEADKYLSVVFTMREDYLADIDDYAPHLPGRLNVRLRMTPLRAEKAIEAIQRPAEKAGREFPKDAAKFIVEDLSHLRIAGREDPIRGEFIEPLHLQIVCYTFWEKLNELAQNGEPTSPITLNIVKQYARVDQVLESYYDNIIRGTVETMSGATEAELRRWIGEKLITSTGIRAQVNRGYFKTDGLPNRVVDYLQQAHLLRVEQSRGGQWYELSHDRFISPIIQSNKKWLAENDSPMGKAATEWIHKKRDSSLLYRGRLLKEAEKTYDRAKLTPVERDFLNASISAEKRNKFFTWAAVVGIPIIIGILSWYARYQKSERVEVKEQFDQQKQISTQLSAELERTGLTPEILASSSPAPSPSPEQISEVFTENNPLVGVVHWRLKPNGDVEYLDNWDTQNIITVDIPQLKDVPGANGGKIQFNKLAADQLKAAWAEVESEDLLDRVLSWEGSLARKSVKGRLSSHALGLAFDINFKFNPSGVVPPAADEEGSVRELVPIFEKHGFVWGGTWKFPDGGHFQVRTLQP
jgi:hypothetical protein